MKPSEQLKFCNCNKYLQSGDYDPERMTHNECGLSLKCSECLNAARVVWNSNGKPKCDLHSADVDFKTG